MLFSMVIFLIIMYATHGTSHDVYVEQVTFADVNIFSGEVGWVDFFFVCGVVDTVFIEHNPLLVVLFLWV